MKKSPEPSQRAHSTKMSATRRWQISAVGCLLSAAVAAVGAVTIGPSSEAGRLLLLVSAAMGIYFVGAVWVGHDSKKRTTRRKLSWLGSWARYVEVRDLYFGYSGSSTPVGKVLADAEDSRSVRFFATFGAMEQVLEGQSPDVWPGHQVANHAAWVAAAMQKAWDVIEETSVETHSNLISFDQARWARSGAPATVVPSKLSEQFLGVVQGIFDGTVAATAMNTTSRYEGLSGLRDIAEAEQGLLVFVAAQRMHRQIVEWGDQPFPTHDVAGEPFLPDFITELDAVWRDQGWRDSLGDLAARRRGPIEEQFVNACASLLGTNPEFADDLRFKPHRQPVRK